MNEKVSVVIPARNEQYLQKTVDDVFAKSRGDIEVIVVLENYWPIPSLKDHPKQTIIHNTRHRE